MELIRIEHILDGKGPFASRKHILDCCVIVCTLNPILQSFERKADELPHPYTEQLPITDHYFAFISLDSLLKYVSKEVLWELFILGFRVYKIEVLSANLGKDQASFQIKHLSNKQDITESIL